jgi:hypothetical protein
LQIRVQEYIRLIKNHNVRIPLSPKMVENLQPNLDAVSGPTDLAFMARLLFGIEEIKVILKRTLGSMDR